MNIKGLMMYLLTWYQRIDDVSTDMISYGIKSPETIDIVKHKREKKAM